MDIITVGGPTMEAGTMDATPRGTPAGSTPVTPGTAVRQVRGYLVVPG
jgi:hypothetical protein